MDSYVTNRCPICGLTTLSRDSYDPDGVYVPLRDLLAHAEQEHPENVSHG